MRCFEEITAGETHEAGPLAMTREAILAFAGRYDPQAFHLDEAAGAASLLDGLAASGWHTAAVGMRLFYDAFIGHVASMGAPGIDELRWLRPVRPGESLHALVTVRSTRISASRPDRGLVGIGLEVRNGAGHAVMSWALTALVLRRGATQPPGQVPARPSGAVDHLPEADLMLSAPYDEVEIGHESGFGTQLFTPALIVEFAASYDPQPFHLDEMAARRTHFGGLCASGWQTAAFWMKHYLAARTRSAAARAAAGLPAVVGGPSPGFADLKWLRPVHAGSTVRYGMRVTGKRGTGRPGWGLISTTNTGHDANGTLVFSFEGRLLWPTDTT